MPKSSADYRASGTEDLGSNPTSKHAAPVASPSASGKDAGGTENRGATTTTKRAAFTTTPSGGAKRTPGFVDSFTDNKV